MECVACTTSFLDPLNGPVVQTCRCISRVCQECRPHMQRCPLCREKTLGEEVDYVYVRLVQKMARSIRCDGCEKTVSTRVASNHLETCPAYLKRRIIEGRLDRLHLTHAYESMAGINQQLRARTFQLSEQVRIMFEPPQYMAPPPPPPPHVLRQHQPPLPPLPPPPPPPPHPSPPVMGPGALLEY